MSNIEAAGFIIIKKIHEKSQSPDKKLLPEFENKDYQFLLLKSAKHVEWGFPKGHTMGEEKILQSAYRELEEETGLSINDVQLLSDTPVSAEYQIDLPAEKGMKKVYYYQAQTLNPEIKLSEEHTEFAWVTSAQAYDLLEHDNMKQLIKYFCQKFPKL